MKKELKKSGLWIILGLLCFLVSTSSAPLFAEEFEDLGGSIELSDQEEAELDDIMDQYEQESEKEGSSLVATDEQAQADLYDESTETPELETEFEPPLAASARIPADASTGTSLVQTLDFKMAGKISQVRVGLNQRPVYRVEKNASMRQVVVYLSDTRAPESLQRAYDTREFPSPVGLFSLLQVPGPGTNSKLIIQLREYREPTDRWEDGTLVLEFPPATQVYATENTTRQSALVQKDFKYGEENIYATDRVFTGKKIKRLEIKDSDIQDVLRLIAKTSGYNLVVGEDVKGKVGTLSLSNIPWDQAFTLVLQTKRLGYVRQGKVLRVATLATLKAEKEAAIANEASKVRVEKLRTVLIPSSYADAKELASRAKGFLSPRGKIDTDGRTNTVIVRDIRSVTERIKKLISALDTQPARVSISAKIVEMVDTFSQQLGFSSIQNSGSFSGVNIENTFNTTLGAANTTSISAAKLANLNAIFKLGQIENQVEVLASPQISAVNNQKANVTQSITQFLPESIFAGGVTTQTFKEIKANLSLDVTPIVSGDGSVFMNVIITNEVPTGPPDQKQIDTRSVSTQVLVENGDTAVIGGIYNSTKTSAVQGLPWLMKVPILGFFVSNRSEEHNRNEILVFLTPKVLNAEASLKKKLS